MAMAAPSEWFIARFELHEGPEQRMCQSKSMSEISKRSRSRVSEAPANNQ